MYKIIEENLPPSKLNLKYIYIKSKKKISEIFFLKIG